MRVRFGLSPLASTMGAVALALEACAPLPSLDAPLDGSAGLDAPRSDVGLDAPASDAPTGDRPVVDVDAPTPLRATVEPVTDRHRAIPGVMFGGWGPHLGHLVRAGGSLYWVDDLCDPSVVGDCDVNINRRIGVFRREDAGFRLLATAPLEGVQQNTGTLATERALHTHGIDVVSGRMTECITDLSAPTPRCERVAIHTGPNANYVGAAISPSGERLAWWTNVSGGGGTFSYIIDYGGGWNGPRTGPVGGYDDFAYAHAAFDEASAGVTFFGQVVSGPAPDWTFATLIGQADRSTTGAPTFSSALSPPDGDPIVSTNDLFVDRRTGDAHLLARAASGAVVYYHRPASGPGAGAFGAPVPLPPVGLRARFLESDRWIAIVSGPATGGLVVRRFLRDAVRAGDPLDVMRADIEEVPAAFGHVLGIYPEADVTQDAPVGGLNFCVVDDSDEHAVAFVALE